MFPRPLLPLPIHHHITSLSQAPQQQKDDAEPQPEHREQKQCEHSKFVGGDAWTQSREVVKDSQPKRGWTSEMIEDERRRGMEVVNSGDLDELDRDFCPEVDILGRHLDI